MRVVVEFEGGEGKIEGGEGKIEGGEGIRGWLRNSRAAKAKSRVVKEFKSGEGKI